MQSEPSLTAIANRHGTDKGTKGPDGDWLGHNYTDIYEAYVGHLRAKRIRLLEIGIGVLGPNWDAQIVRGTNTGGASLKMWADYFPNAYIYGVDINPASHLDSDRIKTLIVDQGDPDALRSLAQDFASAAFDIIIDDGSHRADHQQTSFSLLFDLLKSGGLYFIEDLMDNGMNHDHRGRHASRVPVLSTREVFGALLRTGSLGRPNLITAVDVESRISWVRFHVPSLATEVELTWRPRHPFLIRERYRTGSEKLCVIQHS